jgi:cytochrome c oxidase subunit 2
MIGVIAIAQMMRVYEISSKLRGKKEEEISHRDNVFNANMMLIFMLSFYVFFFWLLAKYGNGGLGPSASEHGVTLDWLLNFNFLIIIIVFFLTNTLLFVFAYKYYNRGPGTKAYWFPHNNRLELLWTSVPAVVLAIIIILGLRAWNSITDYSAKNSTVVEIYGKQFDWTARYSGKDNRLGRADFRMINGDNPLGVVTNLGAEKRMDEMRADVAEIAIKLYMSERNADWILSKMNVKEHVLGDKIEDSTKYSPAFLKLRATHPDYAGINPTTYAQEIEEAIKMVDKNAESNLLTAYEVVSRKQADMWMEKYQRMQRHIIKLHAIKQSISAKEDAEAMDDKVVKELVLMKGKEYEFKIRSMDVIHSVFFPHFRAQMNAVPGMVTRFKFTPILTTKEMREKMQNDKFDYVLLCNKICGAAHSNMQMKVTVVDKKEDYEAFLAAAKSFSEVVGGKKTEESKPEGGATDSTSAPKPDTTKAVAAAH